jgi:hypothetical protein
MLGNRDSVLDCGSPLPLFPEATRSDLPKFEDGGLRMAKDVAQERWHDEFTFEKIYFFIRN